MSVVSIALTTVFGIYLNTKKHDEEAISNNGFGNFVAFLRQDFDDVEEQQKFSDELTRKLENCKDVDHVDQIPVIFVDNIDLNGKKGESTATLIDYNSDIFHYDIYDENAKKIKNPTLESGEIIVPVAFQSLYDAKIGDTISFSYYAETVHYRIAAFMEDPYMGSAMMGVKTLLINPSDFAAMDKNIGIHGIAISVYRTADSAMNDIQFEAELNKNTSLAGYSWITFSRSMMLNYMTMLTNIFSGIMIGFIVMLIFAMLIVLSHNISTSIEQDYVNLGILKAVGVSNQKLKTSLMLGYMLFAVLGCIMGIPCAIPLMQFMLHGMRSSTGLYVSPSPALLESSIALVSILVILIGFISVKLIKLSRITPVRAMNGGKKNVHFSDIGKLPIFKKSLGSSLAYRQLVSGKKQYAGAIAITAILVLFMIMVTDMCIYFDDDGDKLNDIFLPVAYDMTVVCTTEEQAKEVDTIIKKYSDYEKFQFVSQYVALADTQLWCGILNEPERIKTVFKGRTCEYDNEIVITDFIGKNYGIGLGDTVTISYQGKSADYIVSGYCQCSNDSGKNIWMSLEGYERIHGAADLHGYEYVLKDTGKVQDIKNAIDEQYDEEGVKTQINEVWSGMDTIITSVNGIAFIIYILSAIFIIVTIVLVCVKIFIKEKADFGIYKAIGFTSTKLRMQFAIRFVITAFIGSAFGVGLNMLCSDVIIGGIFSTFGISNFKSGTSAAAVIVPVVFMMIVYYIFSYIVSGKMKKVSPRILIAE